MTESPTRPKARNELQILRTRHPPATFLYQLCALLATEGVSITPEVLRGRLDDLPKKDRLLLAVEGDQLVGYAHLRIVHDLARGSYAEVAVILVQPQRRRQGFGRRLITAAETWAQQDQHSHLLLRSDVIRTAGHAFFTSLGYQQDSTKLEFIRSLRS